MPAARTIQDKLLAPARTILDSACRDPLDRSQRLEVLENLAAAFGGFSADAYAERFGLRPSKCPPKAVRLLQEAINQTGIEPAIALAALADAPSGMERRESGAYYTDYRLARRLADAVGNQSPALDAACGSGILLAALAARHHAHDLEDFLRRGVYAADVDPLALRATRLSLAALTDSLDTLSVLDSHLRLCDSLAGGRNAWSDVAPHGFAAVVGNPPWERIRPSTYEFLHGAGDEPTYGNHALTPKSTAAYADYRKIRLNYAARARNAYVHAKGEVDTYKLFLELALELVRPGGCLAFLVPTGLIRSSGAEGVRTQLIDSCGDLNFTFLDNNARYFPIDTRFKFLLVTGRKSRRPENIEIRFSTGNDTVGPTLGLARQGLQKLRPDWSIPEVRSAHEWSIFQRISSASMPLDDDDSPWQPLFSRELDMTLDKAAFQDRPRPGSLPVLEGRMLGHFTHTAKAYVSGKGRAAKWKTNPSGKVAPQFWYPREHLGSAQLSRVNLTRAGYGEVAGQTNERTLRAAIIPPGVACGNKVPTITFPPRDDGVDPHYLWVALANTFCIDWVVRRLVSTTINMFHLRSTPFPTVATTTATHLEKCSKELSTAELTEGRRTALRARIDALVAQELGLDMEDLQVIMVDFPLLDRGEPTLSGEARSTITRDLFFATFLEFNDKASAKPWRDRVRAATRLGAQAYRPSFLVGD